ncbi:M3 family metallopeptidase [Alteromonas sp. 5E99-2]|uniref:M3 family metallopeptidase n=1 Tax=Alteromonas sp. 5E99-2 TaxID=2817683 RepID=UPI001A9A0F68|nr:M3 family metallopeptidase [Alteromonas sp. 5E99-2]MBO1254361.1 M3 family metallopeptidase [Alteromonas sp. 5E99-2]
MKIINTQFKTSLLALSVVAGLGACSKQADTEQNQSSTPSSVQSEQSSAATEVSNPFFTPYKTDFEIPPFSRIKDEHYMPAFVKGMDEHLAEIDAIVKNPEPATFANTVEELERTGKLLVKVQRVFFNLAGSNTNPQLQELQRELSPLLSAHYDKVSLNEDLFKRIETVYQVRDTLSLTAEQTKFLEDTRKGFVRSGALLTEEQKAEITKVNSQLSELTTEYGQNLLAETNGFELILDKADLAGLSDGIIQAAANSAKQKMDGAESEEDKAKYKDKYVFTPHRSSMYPFLTESSRRDLREKLYNAYIYRGDNNNENDNKIVAAKIAQLRAQRAKIMGYETHAHFVLEERMVKTPEGVYDLLMQLWNPALNRAKQEVADMQAVVDAEGHDFTIAAWDWWQYAEKVRKAKYDLDEASLKPYLSLDNVLKGVFDTSNKLWGLTFTELHDIDVYHPDARVWEVKDKDGSHLGVFIGDYFTRSNKRGGAWMSSFKGQSNLDKVERPVVVNVCNFPGPVGDAPALLSFENVTTLFHEFGHALHGLLTNTTYQSMSGTSGPRDFTEFPAQIMEHWASEPEILKTFATHYETGEAIPDALIAKLLKASKFNQGFSNTEYLAASLLDMDWHTLTADDELQDTAKFEKASMEKIGLIGEISPRYRSTYFSHIFAGGYASGYYSYVHSAVLDSDGFAAFKETGNVFDPELAQKLRTHIYEKGSTEEAMTLYKKFRGREPQIEALLKVRGLDGSTD